jgi:bacterioferritin-associated ferredoxin
MVLCICRALPESTVKQAIEAGADDLDEVAEHCGAGTDCGACHTQIRALIDEQRAHGCHGCASPCRPPAAELGCSA